MLDMRGHLYAERLCFGACVRHCNHLQLQLQQKGSVCGVALHGLLSKATFRCADPPICCSHASCEFLFLLLPPSVTRIGLSSTPQEERPRSSQVDAAAFMPATREKLKRILCCMATVQYEGAFLAFSAKMGLAFLKGLKEPCC